MRLSIDDLNDLFGAHVATRVRVYLDGAYVSPFAVAFDTDEGWVLMTDPEVRGGRLTMQYNDDGTPAGPAMKKVYGRVVAQAWEVAD